MYIVDRRVLFGTFSSESKLVGAQFLFFSGWSNIITQARGLTGSIYHRGCVMFILYGSKLLQAWVRCKGFGGNGADLQVAAKTKVLLAFLAMSLECLFSLT